MNFRFFPHFPNFYGPIEKVFFFLVVLLFSRLSASFLPSGGIASADSTDIVQVNARSLEGLNIGQGR